MARRSILVVAGRGREGVCWAFFMGLAGEHGPGNIPSAMCPPCGRRRERRRAKKPSKKEAKKAKKVRKCCDMVSRGYKSQIGFFYHDLRLERLRYQLGLLIPYGYDWQHGKPPFPQRATMVIVKCPGCGNRALTRKAGAKAKHPGREFYVCPVSDRSKQCKVWIGWVKPSDDADTSASSSSSSSSKAGDDSSSTNLDRSVSSTPGKRKQQRSPQQPQSTNDDAGDNNKKKAKTKKEDPPEERFLTGGNWRDIQRREQRVEAAETAAAGSV